MSADNLIMLDKIKGKYEVWMAFASDEDLYLNRFNSCVYKSFTSYEEAIEYAEEAISDNFVEYGLHVKCKIPKTIGIRDCLDLLERARDVLTVEQGSLIDEIDEIILHFSEEDDEKSNTN